MLSPYTHTRTYAKALLIFRATLSSSVRTFGTHTHTRPRGGRALRFRPRDRRKLADYLKERNPEKRKEREKKIHSYQSRESREGIDFVVSPYVKVTASPIVVVGQFDSRAASPRIAGQGVDVREARSALVCRVGRFVAIRDRRVIDERERERESDGERKETSCPLSVRVRA